MTIFDLCLLCWITTCIFRLRCTAEVSDLTIHHWLILTQSIAVTSTISFEQSVLKRHKTVCVRSADPTRLSPLITRESRRSSPKKTARERAPLSGTRTNVPRTNLHHSNLNVSSACLRSTASITERLLGSGCEKTFKALCSITLMCVIDTVRHLVLSIPAEAPSESVKSKNRLHPTSAPPSLRPADRSIVDIALAPWLLTPLEGSSPDGSLSGCFSSAVFARLTTLFGILLLFKQLQCMFGSTRELRM